MSGAPGLRRLFFALWPDAATREALHRATRTIVRHCGGRPVPVANLHLTLQFLGNVSDERLAAVTAAGRAVACPHLVMTLDRTGWFEAAQVLWLGCSEAPEALVRLAGELGQQLVAVAGLTPDPRPFRPHVTLARKVRNPPGLRAPRPVTWTVDGFALLESVTAPDGARYGVLEAFPAPGDG